MGQEKFLAALAYGLEEAEKIKGLIKDPIPIIDITTPNWTTLLPQGWRDGQLLVVSPHARIIARRVAPQVNLLTSLPEQGEQQAEGNSDYHSAVIDDDIVVSARATPATKKAPIWLSPHHLELLSKLFNGHKIELLDERGQIVTTIGGQE